MKRLNEVLLAAAVAVAVAGLGACGERVQTIGVGKSKLADSNAWEVSSSDPYVAPGWRVDDQASWEDHLRRRTQMQNDYAPR
ncbi:MAG TPA: hypothetical protein VL624_19735 [Caldimonas sp.]|jgi:hypothetical protein|nr:hypothetical protein [Caldimonas sp.]